MIEGIAGVELVRSYKLDAPRGVAGRNSDNTMIKQILDWEPNIPLRRGMEEMYTWIEHQYQDRKAGKRTIS
jgi:GDP-D-mannose 3',5'-epimerase